jgi:hypothetical protein
MTGVVTYNFRKFGASQLWDQFQVSTSDDKVYFFIAGNIPWTDDTSPPAPSDTVISTDYNVWRDMLGLKKITQGDVTYAAPRIDWTSGVRYAMYKDNSSTFWANNYYTLTSDFNVYKCLDNNGNVVSTTMPTGTANTAIITADGYAWKYMYSITPAQALSFLTANYMPVQTLTSNDGSYQWMVQQTAANGSIEVVTITSGGTLYGGANGAFVSASGTTCVLDSAASGASGYYNGSSIYVSSGPGAGQVRRVTGWNLSSHTAQLSAAWSTAPTSASSYVMGPTIAASGDGSGFSAYAGISGGIINKVRVVNRGTNYSRISLAVTANTGSGAAVHGHISPPGGHGADAVDELAAHNILFGVSLNGTESGVLMADNSYRIIGLISNPVLYAGGLANSLVYDQTVHVVPSAITGTFQKNETVTGATSLATGNVVDANTTVIRLANVVGTFLASESVTGATSTAYTVTNGAPTLPLIKPFTGRPLYIENRGPIARSPSQNELVKIVIRF